MADGNFLRHEGLRTYLAAHPQHRLVLADLTLTEMFKKNAFGTARASLRILGEFPDQIVALKPTHLWLKVSIQSERDLELVFDNARTEDLRRLCHDYKVDDSCSELAKRMKGYEARSSAYMDLLTEQVGGLEVSLKGMLQEFDDDDLNQMRSGDCNSDSLREKICNLVDEITVEFIRTNQEPERMAPMRRTEAHGMFAYRYALCVVIAFTRWVQLGRSTKRLDRRVNDVIDNQLAAVSTYFNEVLTNDEEFQLVADSARRTLKQCGAFVRPFPGKQSG